MKAGFNICPSLVGDILSKNEIFQVCITNFFNVCPTEVVDCSSKVVLKVIEGFRFYGLILYFQIFVSEVRKPKWIIFL